MIAPDKHIKKRRQYSTALFISLFLALRALYEVLMHYGETPTWEVILFASGGTGMAIIALKAALLLYKLPKIKNK